MTLFFKKKHPFILMKLIFTSLKRVPLTLLGLILLFLVVLAWFQSSRYSERHLFYVGAGTVEVFSSSSLARVSLVPGRVGDFGGKTFYRQRNARGRMLFRPVYPEFAKRSGILEVTVGYWHLGFVSLLALVLAGSWEVSRVKCDRGRKNGAEERN